MALPLGKRLIRRVAPFVLMGIVSLIATAVLSLPITPRLHVLLNGAVVAGFILGMIGLAARGGPRGPLDGGQAEHLRGTITTASPRPSFYSHWSSEILP